MVKKFFILMVLVFIVLQGSSFAIESGGDVVFKDALYGLVIGAAVGGAVYLIDSDDPGEKFGIGIALGTIGGVIYGLYDTRSVVAINSENNTRVAFPTPAIQKTKNSTKVSISLLKVDF
ncbi:MAG: hypothetical protein ACM34I_10565 [bacterium]